MQDARIALRPHAAVIALAALAAITPSVLHAQQVRQDPATGHYYVVVYDDDLRPREILVENAGLVEFSVSPRIERSATGLHYTYEAEVLESSPQAMRTLQFDCPGPEDAIRDLTALRLEEGDTLVTRRGLWVDLPTTCFVRFGARPLKPGQAMRAEFSSTLLPAIGEARGLGAVRGVSWPTSDPHPANDAARAFVRSVQGFTGGWKSVPTIVPARDPALLDDPARGLELVRDDLGRACTELRWITNPGVCRSLQAKLDQAASALGRGRQEAARGELESFLAELEAQHGPQAGKSVSDNAYWLLRINAEYLLAHL